MPVDVEQQLAALGRFWSETVVHVETSEIISHDTARRSPSTVGVEGLAAAPTADQPRGIHQFNEEEATMIELETPSHTDEHRKGSKRPLVAGLLAAAGVIAIALVAIREDAPESPADEPSTTAAVTPTTTPPPALFGAPGVRLAPGTYSVDVVGGVPTTPIHVTVGDGFEIFDDFGLDGDVNTMTFSRLDRVFLDACQPSAGDHPGPLTTLDGLTTALSEQAGWIDVTTPSDISIDGYAGKAFQRTVPADLSTCVETRLNSGEQSVYSPGETVTSWVLDLNGDLIVVEARLHPGQPSEVAAEIAAMLDSIRIAAA